MIDRWVRFIYVNLLTQPVEKVNDVGDVLKKSKGVASKVDDVVKTGTKVAIKSSKMMWSKAHRK